MTKSAKFSVLAGAVAAVLLTVIFSSMSTIHGKDLPDDYFASVPAILGLLNAEWFMGFVFVATVTAVIAFLLFLWRLHKLPVYHARQEDQLLTKVIFGLALCGLFIDKTWWVVAIILAFTPWEEIGKRLARVFGRGAGQHEAPAVTAAAVEEEQQP